MKLRAVTLAVVLAVLATPACSRHGASDNGYRLQLDGRARIVAKDGDRTVSGGRHKLAAGDTVKMLDGSAVLDLPGHRTMLLRAGTKTSSVVDVGPTPDLVDGDAVVVAAEEGAHFTAGEVDVRLAAGAMRVQRRLSVTLAVYRGRATVRSAGRELPGGLAALRQVSIAATGLLPRDLVALVYDDKRPDPWDRQFLGDAIDLGIDLDRRARGFTGQLGPAVHVDAALLKSVIPPLDRESFTVDGGQSPGEALVGAAIVVEAPAGPFAERWSDVFSFRSRGAKWGLVALDQRVKRDALKARLDDAAGRSPLLFAATPRPTTGRPRPGSSSTTTPPGPTGGGRRTTTTTTTAPPIVTIPTITIPPPGGDGSEPPPSPIDVVGAIISSLFPGTPSSTATITTPSTGVLP